MPMRHILLQMVCKDNWQVGVQISISLFSKNNNSGSSSLLNNPIVGNLISSFKNKLSNKYAVSGDQAGNIANVLITNVLGSLINKTNDNSNSNFSIGSLINSLTGNS